MAIVIAKGKKGIKKVRKEGGIVLAKKKDGNLTLALAVSDSFDGKRIIPVDRDPFSVLSALEEFLPCAWKVEENEERVARVAVPPRLQKELIGPGGKVAREIAKWGKIGKLSIERAFPCIVDEEGKVWLTRRGKPFIGPFRPDMVTPFRDEKGRYYLPPWQADDDYLFSSFEETKEEKRKTTVVTG